MNEQEFAELAAGHALHALSAQDEARYAAALRVHPEWEALAAADAETVAQLSEGLAPVAPGARIRDALLAQIASTPQLSPEDNTADADALGVGVGAVSPQRAEPAPAPDPRMPAARAPRKKLRLFYALAASLVLVAGIGYGAVTLTEQFRPPASVVALADIEAAADAQQASTTLENDGTATVHWSAELGMAVLVADGLEPLSAEQSYELWFVRSETPIPAGTFTSDDGETVALLRGDMHAGDVVAVTIEQLGGSPTGLPTSDPVLAIATT